MEENIKQKIIKIEDVKKEFRKPLGQDKIFKFECDIQYDQIRLGLREINVYTPYYYELFFTLKELQEKNNTFKGCDSLEEAKDHLLRLFSSDATILRSLDDNKKIQICVKILNISIIVEGIFTLERKTIEEKDDALNELFDIQKYNIQLFEEIKKICQDEKYKDEKVAGNILNLLIN